MGGLFLVSEQFEKEKHMEQIPVTKIGFEALSAEFEDLKKVNELNLFDGRGFNDGACPACEQPIAEALMPNIVQHDVMSAEESLDYLKNQVKTFSFILDNSKIDFIFATSFPAN